jgi:hypothetical protein
LPAHLADALALHLFRHAERWLQRGVKELWLDPQPVDPVIRDVPRLENQSERVRAITRLEKATMIATIHNEPEFSELFMSYLLTRNSRIEEDLIDQLFNSSEKRLARLLLLLANFGKEGRPVSAGAIIPH